MSGKQHQGTATIRVNGQEYATLEGATFSPSGFEREVVKGAKVYGYREKPREATLDCKFPAGGEGSPAADEINTWTAVTIEFVADTAPSVAEDTAAALEQKSGSAMNQLFNTLSDGWTVISDGLHDVQAMTDTISDKIDALENAVSGMGIVQDISAFTASFTALKGNAAALINAPRRMAESLAGMFAVLAGLPGDPSLSLTGKAGTPSGSLTTNRDSTTEQAMPQLYRTLSSLRYTLSEQDDPQRLIGLTPAAQNNIRLLRSVMQSAALVSQAQTVGKLLDQVIRQNTTHVQDTDRAGGLAWLESSADVQRINRDLSDAMEQQVLDLSAQGHTGTALALRDAGLALTEDLTTRSVHLPGAFQVMVRTTEPALVTLYRATGNSRRWQYFVRRNNIPDPVFVPGGRRVEVISEQQD